MKGFKEYVRHLKDIDSYLTRHAYEIGSTPIAIHGVYSIIEKNYVLGVAELAVSAGGFYMGFRNWKKRKKARAKLSEDQKERVEEDSLKGDAKKEILKQLSETGSLN